MNIFYIKCDKADGVDEWLTQHIGQETVHWNAEALCLIGSYKTYYSESRRSPEYMNRYYIGNDEAAMMFKLTFGDILRTDDHLQLDRIQNY